MSSNEDSGYYFGGNDNWYLATGKIMALCILIILVFLIYYYAWRTYRRHAREAAQLSINEVPASQVLAPHHQQPVNRGLHPSVISSLPTFLYKSEAHQKLNNECAVCLSNLEDGEMARVIPTCKHMFHLQCINMWLFSHSTCPICRSPAQPSSTDDQYLEMSIRVVPSKGPQPGSFSPATPSLEGTSSDASSLTSAEDAYLFGTDKSKKRIRPLGWQTDGVQP